MFFTSAHKVLVLPARALLTGNNVITCADVVDPACVTVTSFGLPVAPVAVTRIVPVRAAPVLAPKAHVMVPAFVPLAPDVMDNQVPPEVTDAVQGMVPVLPLEMLNVVVPASLGTERLSGEITRLPGDTVCPPRTART